jgi:hypothetical protein
MKNIIEKYKISSVWHFTDLSNIEYIKQHGLLSLAELKRREINVPVCGGNNWSHDADKVKGLDEFVHLAFIDDHPMLYRAKEDGRIRNPIWMKIDISILLVEGVRFCADVSNKSGIPILSLDQATKEIDFDVLFTYMDWKDYEFQKRRQAAIKSEILIPSIIPIEKILGYKNG